ncbi:cystatin precursor [Ictalurus punctatus]|uniref:Cystatin n=1 Tax=Ictalurus punctatus TaxID=7998 RepID=E3TGC0_ICTPU|nr:cystatin precursor [Ictalurus punctatus]ADO29356.1 cystatin [Ictalurus punctatus]
MLMKVVAPLLAVFLALASAGLLGGPVDVDINREDVQNALQFAVSEHNKASNDAFVSQVSRVIKAQTQVVSGVNYIFTVELVRTACRKGGVEKVCPTLKNPDPAVSHECRLKVWNQPWTGTIKLVENTCQ